MTHVPIFVWVLILWTSPVGAGSGSSPMIVGSGGGSGGGGNPVTQAIVVDFAMNEKTCKIAAEKAPSFATCHRVQIPSYLITRSAGR